MNLSQAISSPPFLLSNCARGSLRVIPGHLLRVPSGCATTACQHGMFHSFCSSFVSSLNRSAHDACLSCIPCGNHAELPDSSALRQSCFFYRKHKMPSACTRYTVQSQSPPSFHWVTAKNHKAHVRFSRVHRKLQYLPSRLPYLRLLWRESF
jgi:hypothetical protein